MDNDANKNETINSVNLTEEQLAMLANLADIIMSGNKNVTMNKEAYKTFRNRIPRPTDFVVRIKNKIASRVINRIIRKFKKRNDDGSLDQAIDYLEKAIATLSNDVSLTVQPEPTSTVTRTGSSVEPSLNSNTTPPVVDTSTVNQVPNPNPVVQAQPISSAEPVGVEQPVMSSGQFDSFAYQLTQQLHDMQNSSETAATLQNETETEKGKSR